ncbi:hypothetical protein D781_0543 [Serratia sp. FGI94]|nr:hypothetical protein D781_0543 [Serratia sp. FGI94]
MKIAALIGVIVWAICSLVKYFHYRSGKKNFDAFYQDYLRHGYPIPPHIAFVDNLGYLGNSLKTQWFKWILLNKKITITKNVRLQPAAYLFVQDKIPYNVRSWIHRDIKLLITEVFLFSIAFILMLISAN